MIFAKVKAEPKNLWCGRP